MSAGVRALLWPGLGGMLNIKINKLQNWFLTGIYFHAGQHRALHAQLIHNDQNRHSKQKLNSNNKNIPFNVSKLDYEFWKSLQENCSIISKFAH